MMKENDIDVEANVDYNIDTGKNDSYEVELSTPNNDEPMKSMNFKGDDSSNPFATRTGKSLSWSNVNMTLAAVKDKPERKLLDGVWGEVPQKEITAIMGPSGSGKTSLLNILSGRAKTRGKITINANVKFDGAVIKPTKISVRRQIAFVPQEESLQITSTAREAIEFSAKLRLPRSTTDQAIKNLASVMLRELGLVDCADTMIGGGLIKGISGGEKKRTSVGVELVVKPTMVFLDEPTSGLDSFSAVQLSNVLKKVANAGAAVLFTIHQPPSEVFNSFDHLILLNNGRVMYEGQVDDVPSFFAACKKPLPPRFNPADWILQVAQTYSVEQLDRDGFFPNDPNEEIAHSVASSKSENPRKAIAHAGPNSSTQLSIIFRRELQAFTRDKGALIARLSITGLITLVAGMIFYKVGENDMSNPQNLQSSFGALIIIQLNTMFGTAQPALLGFPTERPVFVREYSTNHYSVLSYFLAKFVMEALLTGLQTMVSAVIAYFLMAFQMSFEKFFLTLYALALSSNAVAVLLGSLTKDPNLAQELVPLLFVPQMFFAGFFVSIELIPGFLRWCQYICYLTYSVRIILVAEFGNCKGEASVACDQLLKSVGVSEDDIWWNWLILIGIFFTFRITALMVLRSKATQFF